MKFQNLKVQMLKVPEYEPSESEGSESNRPVADTGFPAHRPPECVKCIEPCVSKIKVELGPMCFKSTINKYRRFEKQEKHMIRTRFQNQHT